MRHQRNVEGLRSYAQQKRQESFEKVDQGIKQLLRAGRSINFNTVAEASGVSKAWLYKEPDIKARIEQLREQGVTKKSVLEEAMESLKEAIAKNRVYNPSGFLYQAVTDAWKPNESHEQKVEQEIFAEWWKPAYSQGIVVAATQIDGVQHVLTVNQHWIPFSEILKQFPLEAFSKDN